MIFINLFLFSLCSYIKEESSNFEDQKAEQVKVENGMCDILQLL